MIQKFVQHPLPPQSAAALESVYSTPGGSHPGVSGPPAAYSSEHTQSAPGRRTPLGAVGLGGFYFQQQPQPHASSSALSDENRPDERFIFNLLTFLNFNRNEIVKPSDNLKE